MFTLEVIFTFERCNSQDIHIKDNGKRLNLRETCPNKATTGRSHVNIEKRLIYQN